LLSPAERQRIQEVMNLVAEHLETEADTDTVKASCQALNVATSAFAARRMDASIRKALTGRLLDTIS
jgi:molecular chaperone HscA